MTLRAISLFVASVFSVTTLIQDPSSALASLSSLGLQAQSKFQKELQDCLYSVPAEIGSIQEMYVAPRAAYSDKKELVTPYPGPRAVILIQDAHANPEGQRNVAAMMHYLEAKFPDLAIGLEGAVGELHPEYLDLFKEFPDANQAVVEDLKQKGELNGAELFLLQKSQKRPETRDQRPETKNFEVLAPVSRLRSAVFGVENPELYRDNLLSYRALLSKRDEMQALLRPVRSKLEKESSTKLNGELRGFLKERSRRKEGRFDVSASQSDPDLQAYIRYLQKQSRKHLKVDLKDPIEQLRFPSLLRVVMLEEIQKGFDPEKAKSQWAEVVRTLEAAAKDPSDRDFVDAVVTYSATRNAQRATNDGNGKSLRVPEVIAPALYPRKLLERLFRFGKKHKLSFAGQEAFWQGWKLAVFQAEIDVTDLLQEMSVLEGGLIQKLARSEDEKALVQKIENLDLLEKLLRLELSRSDYDKALEEQSALNSLIASSKPLTMFLNKAFDFYGVSLKRDEALVENLLKLQDKGWRMEDGENLFASSAIRALPPRVSVLYAGGFHTPGIEAILRQKGIGYAVFTPRITQIDRGQMYQDVMSDANADLSAYFKVKNPFQTKQEALIFKQLVETAAPVLSGKYQLGSEQVAAHVAQAVNSSPVFSGVLKADQPKDQPATVRFTPETSSGVSISQNSSVMPVPATIGRAEARLLDPVPQFASGQAAFVSFGKAGLTAAVQAGSVMGFRSETRGGKPSEEALRRESLEALKAVRRSNPWSEGMDDFEDWDFESPADSRPLPRNEVIYPRASGDMLEFSSGNATSPAPAHFPVFIRRIMDFLKTSPEIQCLQQGHSLFMRVGDRSWTISPPTASQDIQYSEERRQYLQTIAENIRAAIAEANEIDWNDRRRSEARSGEAVEIRQKTEGFAYEVFYGAKQLGEISFAYGPHAAAAKLVEILRKAGLSVHRDPGAPHRIIFDAGREIGAVSVPVSDLKQLQEWLSCVVTVGPSVAAGRMLVFFRDGVPVIHLRSEVRDVQHAGHEEVAFLGAVTLPKTIYGKPVTVTPQKHVIFWWISPKNYSREKEEKDYEEWYEKMHALLKKYLPLPMARQWSVVLQHEKKALQLSERQHPGANAEDLKNHLIAKLVQVVDEKLEKRAYAELQENKNSVLIFRMLMEDQARIAAVNAKASELLSGADEEKRSAFFKTQKAFAEEVVQKRLTEIRNEMASAQNRQKKMKQDEKQVQAWQEELVRLVSDESSAGSQRIRALQKAVSKNASSAKAMKEAADAELRADLSGMVLDEFLGKIQGSEQKTADGRVDHFSELFFESQARAWKSLSAMLEKLIEAEKKVERKEEGAEKVFEVADHSFATAYDTGRLFRDAGAEFFDRLEQTFPGLERKLVESGESQQLEGAVVLVVDGPVTAEDVKKELRKYGSRVTGIVGGWGTTSSHWAQLVRGMEQAPPIFFFSDNNSRKAAFQMLNESQTVVFKFSKELDWQLLLHPSEKTLSVAASDQQKEKLLEEGQRTLLGYPIDISVNINLAAGQWVDLEASEADGSGLIRTDFLDQEEQGLLVKIEKEMISGSFNFKEWFSALKGFTPETTEGATNDAAEFQGKVYEALKDSTHLQRLLGALTGRYHSLLNDPFFRGKKVPFRTLDLQNDSKGKELLQEILRTYLKAGLPGDLLQGIPDEVARDPIRLSEAICGFDFYKKTTLGRFFLIAQMAAFFIAYGQHLGKNAGLETALLQVFFPMVSSVEDVDFIQNEILPVAKMLAALNLDPKKEWSQDNLREAAVKMDRIVTKVQFGIMVEVLEILENDTLAASLANHPFVSFFKVGTNDLELAIVRRKLDKQVSRDDENIQSLFGHLNDPLRKGLDRFFEIVMRDVPGKPICICGALGGDPVFQLYLEHWRRRGLKTAVSVGMGDVLATHHRFLRYRMLPDDDLKKLFRGTLNEQTLEYEARLTVDEALDPAGPFLMREAAFEKRDRQSGFLQGIDRDTVDPTQKIGGFADVLGLQGLLRDSGEADLNEEVDPDVLIRDAEPLLPEVIEREIIRPLLRRGILPEAAKASFLNSIVFLQNAWKLQRRLAAQEERFQGVLRGKDLDDFIEIFEKEGSFGVFSPAEAALEKQDVFCSRYYSSTRLIRDTSLSVIHERFLELYGEEVQDEGEVAVLGNFSSEGAVALRLRRWRGMMAKQDQRPGYSDVFELYIPVSAKEKGFVSRERVVSYLKEHPVALMHIFTKSGWQGDREIRISYPLRQMMREAIASADLSRIAPEEMAKLRASFSAFLRETRDQSYPVFRMDIFGFFEKFFPGFQEMVGYFPKDGRKRPLHVRVLSAYGFLERLPQNLDFPFQRASRIVQRLRRGPETLAMLRMSVLAGGIVAARFKKRGEIPSAPEVLEIVEQLLAQWGIEFTRDFIERMAWLIRQEVFFHDQDLMTLREIAKAIESLLESVRVLNPQDLDLLYLLLFSSRATRVDQEKRVMLKIQGPDSSLANWDKFYLAALHAVHDRNKSGSMRWDELAIAASQAVRSGKTAIGSAENLPVSSSSMASVIGNTRFLWQEFRRLLSREMERFQSLNGVSEDLSETVKAIGADYRLFLENMSRMEKLMTPYYLRSLPDSAHWVSVFLSFLSLRSLEKTQKGTVVFNANALTHQYANQAFEISFMRPVTEPGMLAIYSRILFNYGFSIESVDVERHGEQVLARFVGSFFEEKHPSELLRSMAKDLRDIFGDAQPEYHQRALWWERFVRFLYKIARPLLVLFSKDQRSAPELFRNMYRLYGDLQVSRPASSALSADSVVTFTGDRHKNGMEYSTFEIETEDRPRGLTALISAFFALRGLNIVNFHFDDTQGQRCRIIVHANEAQRGVVLSRKEHQYIAEHLPLILNAPKVGVHRFGFLNRYEIVFRGERNPVTKTERPLPGTPVTIAKPAGEPAPARSSGVPETSIKAGDSDPIAMTPAASEYVRSYTVNAHYGIHVRCAGLLSKLAKKHAPLGVVMIESEGGTAQLSNIMQILSLEAVEGKRVAITIPQNTAASSQERQAFWEELEAIMDGDEAEGYVSLFSPVVEQGARSEMRIEFQDAKELTQKGFYDPKTKMMTVGVEDEALEREKLKGVQARSDVAAEDRPGRSEMRGSINYERIINLLHHGLSGKIGVMLDAVEEAKMNVHDKAAQERYKKNLRNAVREALALLRIFNLEKFLGRRGELYVPEGDENKNIFAYRILSRGLDRVYQNSAFVGRSPALFFDEAGLRQISAEVGFERFYDHFSDVVTDLELLRDELARKDELTKELCERATALGQRLLAKMKSLPAQPIEERPAVAATPAKQIKRILVVDDEPVVRVLLTRQLQHVGTALGLNYVVISASDGVEAWEKVQAEDFDVVFTDLTMPRMGGIELSGKIADSEKKPAIVFVSGWSSSSVSLEEWNEKLSVDFLQKPFMKEDLQKLIAKISGRSEARAGETADEDALAVEIARRLGIQEDLAGQKISGLSLEEFARRKHLFAATSRPNEINIWTDRFWITKADDLWSFFFYHGAIVHGRLGAFKDFVREQATWRESKGRLKGGMESVEAHLKDPHQHKALLKWAILVSFERNYEELSERNEKARLLFGRPEWNVQGMDLGDLPLIPVRWSVDDRLEVLETELEQVLSRQPVELSTRFYELAENGLLKSLREVAALHSEGKISGKYFGSLEKISAAPARVEQMELPLLFRSEARLEGTAAFKSSLMDMGSFSVAPEVPAVAEKIGGIYSALAIAADLDGGVTEDNLRNARLYITSQLLKAFRTQRNVNGKIDNPALQKVLGSLESYAVTGNGINASEERGIHVALPVLERAELEALAGLSPIFLALAVSLNAKLYLNAQVDRKGVSHLKTLFLEAARRNGITMGENQFEIFSAFEGKGSVFTSREQQGIPEDALLAAQEAQLPDSHDRATLWYNSKRAQQDMKILAAEIAEALYAALDQTVTKNSKRDISTYGQQLTTAIVNAIQASLKILVAA